MTDWADTLAAPIEAVRHGVDAADRLFASTHTGPLSFTEVDYPAAQVYTTGFARTGPTDWEHTITATLYFDWDRTTNADYIEDVVHPVAGVVDEVLAALGTVDCITDYHPARMDFFTGEPSNTLVLAVSIEFKATTLLDPAEF